MAKSLRKGIKRNPTEKVSKNLHLVKGEHNITHSHAPISADEIERLEAINPEYVNRLFSIMEKSIEVEEKEVELYFEAVDKEQNNDELSIIEQSELANKSLTYSVFILIFLILSSLGFTLLGYPIIAGMIISSVIGVVIKAVLSKKEKNNS